MTLHGRVYRVLRLLHLLLMHLLLLPLLLRLLLLHLVQLLLQPLHILHILHLLHLHLHLLLTDLGGRRRGGRFSRRICRGIYEGEQCICVVIHRPIYLIFQPPRSVEHNQRQLTMQAIVENAEGTEPFCEEVFRLDARGFFARKKGE
jgi:hypothetical protein